MYNKEVIIYSCIVGLTDFLSKLDERYDNKVKKDGTAMARKQRRMGCKSSSRPPEGAPRWTVDPEWIGLLIIVSA